MASYSVHVGPRLFHELKKEDSPPEYGVDYARRGGEYISDEEIIPARQVGGNRKPIMGFSRRARRNMAQAVYANPQGFNGHQALTFPDDVFWEPVGGYSGAQRFLSEEEIAEVAKDRYLRRFKARVSRVLPGATFVWRLEIEKRKRGSLQGTYVVHFHLVWALTFCWCELDYIPFVKRTVEMWLECIETKHPDAFEVHFTRERRGKKAWEWLGDDNKKLLSYIMKYVGKDGHDYQFRTGRLWGLHGVSKRARMRTAEIPLTQKESEFFRQVLGESLRQRHESAMQARYVRLLAAGVTQETAEKDIQQRTEKFEWWLKHPIGRYFRTHLFMDRGEILDLIWLAKNLADQVPF